MSEVCYDYVNANSNIHSSNNNIVTECEIQMNDTDTTFEACVECNTHQIQQTVDEYQRLW